MTVGDQQPRRLPTVQGWTVDARLRQFRRNDPDAGMVFVDWDTEEGQRLASRLGQSKATVPQPMHKPDADLWCTYCGQLVPKGDIAENDPCPSINHPDAGWWNQHGPEHRGWCMQCTPEEELP